VLEKEIAAKETELTVEAKKYTDIVSNQSGWKDRLQKKE